MRYTILILALFATQASAQNWGYQPSQGYQYFESRPRYQDGGPAIRGFGDYSGKSSLEPQAPQYIPYIPENRSPFQPSGLGNKYLNI